MAVRPEVPESGGDSGLRGGGQMPAWPGFSPREPVDPGLPRPSWPGPQPPGAGARQEPAGRPWVSEAAASWTQDASPAGEPTGHRRAHRAREHTAFLGAGLVLALAGVAFSVLGVAHQFLPRTFSAAQRQQIIAWEIGKRWRTWPAGQIFPAVVDYRLPGYAFGGTEGLSLVAHRVGIARQARCGQAADAATARVLARHGCLAVLRATYTDQTQSLAVTVGVAVLPSARAARAARLSVRPTPGARGPGPLVLAVRFRRTSAVAFSGRAARVPWARAAGPYLVLAAAGYADGRPWRSAGSNYYARSELVSLAGGVGRSVASRLEATPPQPRCPGSPGC